MAGYIEFRNVKKIYTMGEVQIHALDGVNFPLKKENLSLLLESAAREKAQF